jgi:hypothetical protein
MKIFSYASKFAFACAVGLLGFNAEASAQEWHESPDWGTPAILPDQDNDGPGNRMGRSSCDFVMNSGRYSAALLVYQSGPNAPYSAAEYGDGRWEILESQGTLDDYQFSVKLMNQCVNPADPTVHESVTSDWLPLTEDGWSNGWYEGLVCPEYAPQLVQAWCKTRVFW